MSGRAGSRPRKLTFGLLILNLPPLFVIVLNPQCGCESPGAGIPRARCSAQSSAVMGLLMLNLPPLVTAVDLSRSGWLAPGAGICAFLRTSAVMSAPRSSRPPNAGCAVGCGRRAGDVAVLPSVVLRPKAVTETRRDACRDDCRLTARCDSMKRSLPSSCRCRARLCAHSATKPSSRACRDGDEEGPGGGAPLASASARSMRSAAESSSSPRSAWVARCAARCSRAARCPKSCSACDAVARADSMGKSSSMAAPVPAPFPRALPLPLPFFGGPARRAPRLPGVGADASSSGTGAGAVSGSHSHLSWRVRDPGDTDGSSPDRSCCWAIRAESPFHVRPATLCERAQNLSFVCNLGPLLQAPPFSRKPIGFNPVATPLVLGIN